MQIGTRFFDFENKAYIMGILNVTPDSFSDGGNYIGLEEAVAHGLQMIEEGVDIIDIGGESTRPGHAIVTEEAEIQRVVPIIQALRKLSDIPISIDTSKAKVAEAAILAGADLINDVWGFKKDLEIAQVCAKYHVPCCLMHNRNTPQYTNLLEDMCVDLEESIEIATQAGVEKSQIMIDPGVGFGKTLEHNLEVMANLEVFMKWGYPVLLGTSRKSMIGLTLELPVDQRLEGTLATTVIGYMKGCTVFRVHDVQANKRALVMTEAIVKKSICTSYKMAQ